MSELEQSIADYSYELPGELIADKPLPTRDQSRLLAVSRETGAIVHSRFDALPGYLKSGDVLVINDTKVIPAKIFAQRESGGHVRLLLIKPETARPGLWQAMVQPIKRLKPGEILQAITASGTLHAIKIVDIITAEDGFKRLLVDLGDGAKVFQLLSEIGSAPLPPYILRNKKDGAAAETFSQDDDDFDMTSNSSSSSNSSSGECGEAAPTAEETRSFDLDRYQTVFARTPGAVAAPTAGLHFSENLLKQLEQIGVQIYRVTLHVGPGTFKPIESSVANHFVEPEIYFVPEATAAAVSLAKHEKRRVIAVGTTSMRALESAAEGGGIRPVDGESTNLYVKPGYKFKIVDAMITNFHLSRSSLLVLVSTFAGHELTMRAYKEAIDQRYRFYSYGDAMFIA